MLVDDEPKIIEVLAAYLELAGYRVLTALTGTEAEDLLSSNQLDLVVLDYMLPDIEGPELCRKIRKLSDLPILMFSARVTQADITKSFKLGVTEYVTKPVSPKALVDKVRKVLDNNSGEKPNPYLKYNAV